MSSPTVFDQRQLYRLPWTRSDSATTWLAPTSACNLTCDGCYRDGAAGSHKSLDLLRKEIDAFGKLRNADGLTIAGGDPLMHPKIVEIVRMVSNAGLKPIINTNGALLTEDLVRDLKRAGAHGFMIHIDSRQGRPKWRGNDEAELKELRLHYAEMLARAGGLSCGFISTVYDDTLAFVPELVEWAGRHIDIVHVMAFILHRVEGREPAADLTATDVVAEIRKRYADFMPAASWSDDRQPDSFTWLLSGKIASKRRTLGYVGPKFMEAMQSMHRHFKGRRWADAKPSLTSMGHSILLFSALDPATHNAAKTYLKSVFYRPAEAFRRVYYQSIMIIQPVECLPNAVRNMRDGCPDVTLWNGELAWSCRLEELKQFGCWARSASRPAEERAVSGAPEPPPPATS